MILRYIRIRLIVICLMVVSALVACRSDEPTTGIENNADWMPVERVFDGVTMVQVPTGCFTMGDSAMAAHRPAHRQCFDAAFWIDKYEVTQADFARLGGVQANSPTFSGDDLPVVNITWFEANTFCESRGGRLPSEVEWEYAARGPDDWLYPWGNAFNAAHVAYTGNSPENPVPIGRYPDRVSWVGAFDMSGNVREWTRSEFRNYPYDASDGRENPAALVRRVLRGGSWRDNANGVSAVVRPIMDVRTDDSWSGFRCVHSSEE